MTTKKESKKQTETMSKIKEAKKKAESLKSDVDEMCDENGWDIEVDEEKLAEIEVPKPKVRLVKIPTVRDGILAEKIARRGFDLKKDEEPTAHMVICSKLSLVATFDDKKWNIEDIQNLGETFFNAAALKFMKHLS